jgi:hypothetical protein
MKVNFITMSGICENCRKEYSGRKCGSKKCELRLAEEEKMIDEADEN